MGAFVQLSQVPEEESNSNSQIVPLVPDVRQASLEENLCEDISVTA